MTRRMPTGDARKGFASVLRSSAAGERIKLTRYNKTVAVIIPKKDLVELEGCEEEKAKEGSPEPRREGHDRADDRCPETHGKSEK